MPQAPLQANVAVNQVTLKSAPLQIDGNGNLLTGNGSLNKLNITSATLVKAASGRICRVNVNTAGSTTGTVNDIGTTGGAAAGNLVFSIPNTAGSYPIDFPCLVGIVVVPGTGQVLSVSYD